MKSKKPMGFDQNAESPGDMNIDLQTGDEDDDIIDLEDIIEMPGRAIDEEEDIDMDVEILDAEPGLVFDSPEKPGKAAPQPSSQKDSMDLGMTESEQDAYLLEDFDPDDEEDLFEKMTMPEPEKEQAEGEPIFDEEDDLLLDDILNEVEKPQSEPPDENQHALRERAAAALKIEDATDKAPIPEPPAAEPEHLQPAPEIPVPEAEHPEPAPEIPATELEHPEAALEIPAAAAVAVLPEQAASQPAPSPGGVDEFMIAELVEELVGRIESRLMDTVRQAVEARLPEIARDVIREEIERVKKEIEP